MGEHIQRTREQLLSYVAEGPLEAGSAAIS